MGGLHGALPTTPCLTAQSEATCKFHATPIIITSKTENKYQFTMCHGAKRGQKDIAPLLVALVTSLHVCMRTEN